MNKRYRHDAPKKAGETTDLDAILLNAESDFLSRRPDDPTRHLFERACDELAALRSRLAEAERWKKEATAVLASHHEVLQGIPGARLGDTLAHAVDRLKAHNALLRAVAESTPEMSRRVRLVAEFYPDVGMCEGDEEAASMAWDVLNVSLEAAEQAIEAARAGGAL